MATYILTSMFHNGFDKKTTKLLEDNINNRKNFAFVASSFENGHEITDKYFELFINMFHKKGIYFENEYVVDSRMTKMDAQQKVKNADVIWLAGGDTPTQ